MAQSWWVENIKKQQLFFLIWFFSKTIIFFILINLHIHDVIRSYVGTTSSVLTHNIAVCRIIYMWIQPTGYFNHNLTLSSHYTANKIALFTIKSYKISQRIACYKGTVQTLENINRWFNQYITISTNSYGQSKIIFFLGNGIKTYVTGGWTNDLDHHST